MSQINGTERFLEDGSISYQPSTPGDNGFDFLLRMKGDSSEKITLSQINTSLFTEAFDNILNRLKKANSVLIETVKKQKFIIEYNSLYNAFLIGGIDEEEFESKSEEYIIEHKSCENFEELIEEIGILLTNTELPFTTQELSDIFETEEEDILKAIQESGLILE